MTKTTEKDKTVVEMNTKDITTNGNVRTTTNKQADIELADSIMQYGIIEPLIVRRKDGKTYLVAGHRRLMAARSNGLKTVPVRVMDLTDEQADRIQLIENIQRQSLNPIEEANAYLTLAVEGMDRDQKNLFLTFSKSGLAPSKDFMKKCADVGAQVGKGAKEVYQTIRLLELPDDIKKLISNGKLTSGHGRVILSVAPPQRPKLFDHIRHAMPEEGCEDKTFPVSELLSLISRNIERKLSLATWAMDERLGDRPICSQCAYNGSNQDELFAEAEENVCNNATCFNAKKILKLTKTKGELAKKMEGTFMQKVKFLKHISKAEGYDARTQRQFSRIPTEYKGSPVMPLNGLPKDVAAAVVERPDSFRWANVKPNTPVLVVLNTGALPKATVKKLTKDTKNDKATTPTTKPRDPKAVFVSDYISEEIPKLVAEAIKKVKDADLLKFITNNGPSISYNWGDSVTYQCGEQKKGQVLTASQVLHVLVDLLTSELTLEEFKPLFDVRKIEKAATAEAEKAWTKRQAEPKTETKKEESTHGDEGHDDGSDAD